MYMKTWEFIVQVQYSTELTVQMTKGDKVPIHKGPRSQRTKATKDQFIKDQGDKRPTH